MSLELKNYKKECYKVKIDNFNEESLPQYVLQVTKCSAQKKKKKTILVLSPGTEMESTTKKGPIYIYIYTHIYRFISFIEAIAIALWFMAE